MGVNSILRKNSGKGSVNIIRYFYGVQDPLC